LATIAWALASRAGESGAGACADATSALPSRRDARQAMADGKNV
jgi:hypothetical protein